MSLYTDLIEAGVEVSNWQSDLYFPRTEATRAILARHPEVKASVFKSNTTGQPTYEVPFAFDPYWDARKPSVQTLMQAAQAVGKLQIINV